MLNFSKDLQKSVKDMVKVEVDTQLGAKLEQVEVKLNVQMDKKIEEISRGIHASNINQGVSQRNVSDSQIKDVVREAYKEEKLKDSKKPNLIMFNLPEIKSRDWLERKRNNMEMVLKVFNFLIDMDDIKDKIVRVVRMGRWIDQLKWSWWTRIQNSNFYRRHTSLMIRRMKY